MCYKGDEWAFRSSCRCNRIEVAKWLYSLGNVDIKVCNDTAFRMVCEYRHIELIEWLCSICNDYEYTENDDTIMPLIKNTIEYYIQYKLWDKFIEKTKMILDKNINIEDCSICYDKGNLLSNCGHSFCIECFMTWHSNNTICPYCKQNIKLDECKINL